MWIKNVTSIRKLWKWCGINDLFLLFIYAIDEVEKWILSDFFFFKENFNLWHPFMMITHYHQTKIPISFWCSRGSNLRSLIQPSKTLAVELTRTHLSDFYTCILCLFQQGMSIQCQIVF